MKFSKSKGFRNNLAITSLESYINRYGKEIGVLKYKERIEKISKLNIKHGILKNLDLK